MHIRKLLAEAKAITVKEIFETDLLTEVDGEALVCVDELFLRQLVSLFRKEQAIYNTYQEVIHAEEVDFSPHEELAMRFQSAKLGMLEDLLNYELCFRFGHLISTEEWNTPTFRLEVRSGWILWKYHEVEDDSDGSDEMPDSQEQPRLN